MTGNGVSRLQELVKLATGVALVVGEAVAAAPPLRSLRAGDLGGAASATVKGLIDVAADVTGLTRGRVHRYRAQTQITRSGVGGARQSTPFQHFDEFAVPVRPETESGHDRSKIKTQQLQDQTAQRVESSAAASISGRKREPQVTPATSRPMRPTPDDFSYGSAVSNDRKARARSDLAKEKSEEARSLSAGKVNEAKLEEALQKVGDRAPPARKRRKPRERHVPATPFGRVLGFAELGAGLVWGTVQESAKRIWQGQGANSGGSLLSPFMNEQNAERMALALCRMRGAALKLGQMLSIQDESLVPPQILAALESVRQGADVMPKRQLDKVLVAELGPDWRDRLDSFDEEPIAAASIGQVHRAVLKDGRVVAMKVQYPGVANSIDSDIENVKRLLDYTNLIPEGLYLDQAMKVAKQELARECDYELEASNQKRFKELLTGEQGFHVPKVIDDFCSKRVLTTELVPGVSIDKVAQLGEETRNHVASRLLALTLMELFQFRFMQTDPNWSNFLYDEATDTINLIDFGAARDYPKDFVDNYLVMVRACADKDRAKVIEMSVKLGFLTGKESRIMLDAHVEAAFVVGMPFSQPGGYDFRSTNLTRRISDLGTTMLRHRLTPPPDEAYSLHRKLSGAFLACIKLRAVVPCREMFLEVYDRHKFCTVEDEEQETLTEALASGVRAAPQTLHQLTRVCVCKMESAKTRRKYQKQNRIKQQELMWVNSRLVLRSVRHLGSGVYIVACLFASVLILVWLLCEL